MKQQDWGVTVADQEQLAILKQGVEVWNNWQRDNPSVEIDLRNANLRETILPGANLWNAYFTVANLTKANLNGANLTKADLYGANLREANLREASLPGANLSEAHLNGADLTRANLSGAILPGANLSEADLSGADLPGADLSGAYLYGANLTRADLSGADLSGAHLNGATLIESNLTNATLTDCRIYGISAWDLKLEGAEQSNLVITRDDEPTVTVSNMKVAQFLYLLINNPEIRDAIDTITSKVVLILGRFTDERISILEALRTELQKRDYIPVLFDFDAPKSRHIEETVSTIAHMARFIIADITDPRAIPQELTIIVRNLQTVPVLPLLHESGEPWGMYASIDPRSTVLPILKYSSESELIGKIQSEVIQVAEQKVIELKPKAT